MEISNLQPVGAEADRCWAEQPEMCFLPYPEGTGNQVSIPAQLTINSTRALGFLIVYSLQFITLNPQVIPQVNQHTSCHLRVRFQETPVQDIAPRRAGSPDSCLRVPNPKFNNACGK